MKSVQIALGVIIIDGQLPLIKFKRNDLVGQWGILGGKFSAREFLPQAIEREMFEELEHKVAFKEFLAVIDEELLVHSEIKRVTLFACTVEPTGPVSTKTIDKDEGTIQWFDVTEIAEMESQIVASDYRILHDIYLGGGRGYYKSILRKNDKKTKLELFEKI